LLGSFDPVTISVPRARLNNTDGVSREWHSEALPRYVRMTKRVEAAIAGTYLSGTNTRRVRRALGALFKGAVGKDVVSRTWRKCRRTGKRGGGARWLKRMWFGPGWHGGKGAARPQGDIDLAAGCAGHSARWAEGAACGAQQGGESEAAWRGLLDDLIEHGLVRGGLGHHRWCGGPGESARPGVA
jgi:putative transposase